MKFTAPALVLLTAASTANAAECYAQGGNSNRRCVTKSGIWQFREWFCTQNWSGSYQEKTYNDNNGFSAKFSHSGAFASQQQCWDSTEDIINKCLGKKDGGSWTTSQVSVNIGFCS
ncbi:hypothetical protein CC80DRAFT_593670 [Byssothecium circinans]|uniref:Uncharacterized protein n=1 Tax=Byssothecium circinans TaxID=147558 RepID=A0A6A5TU97_9PLEO|nr:hypothetical protein CC80DRAFT_593670 [Byssothecium circinans]